MADPIGQAAQGTAASAATKLEAAIWDALGIRDAAEGARRDAEASGLPGLSGRPGDAYRHLLIAGEMKRRFGPLFATLFGSGHELVNQLADSQTPQDEHMDNYNNQLAANGPAFETWEDVVRWARAKIAEAAPHGGDGEDGRAFWYRKQPSDWRPDFTNAPITPIENGGPEHGYGFRRPPRAMMVEPMAMAKASDTVGRPVASWTEADVRAAMNSSAYRDPQHPDHRQVQHDVRAWFERHFSAGPIPTDATGRPIRRAAATTGATAGACPVHVRGYARDGGKVAVRAYCRSLPSS